MILSNNITEIFEMLFFFQASSKTIQQFIGTSEQFEIIRKYRAIDFFLLLSIYLPFYGGRGTLSFGDRDKKLGARCLFFS